VHWYPWLDSHHVLEMIVPTPVPASATLSSNILLGDALARAQALAVAKPALKRPSGDHLDEAPAVKKSFQQAFSAMESDMSTDQVMVPDNMVGLIIGRGGEQITRLQAESGCKIQMSQDGQGSSHRMCTLTGTADAISIARNMIEAIIDNEGNKYKGMGGGGGMAGMGASGGGATSYEMMIPGRLVARIIGKGGEVIKALQEETGAKIVIIQDTKEFADEKPLKITGPPDIVEFAKLRVEQIIAEEEEKLGRGGFRGGRGGHGGFRGGHGGGGWQGHGYGHDSSYDMTDTMTVPSSKVGIVMGKGGETIRMICSESGAHCQVDKSGPDGAREKTIVIKGRPEAVLRAKEMINDKVGGGGGFDRGQRGGQGYVHRDQLYPSLGGAPAQPDYSGQWAEYYRSLGMVKEAEIIEQQSLARAAPVQSAQPSDYSAQWAEYYRSVGKVKEAEAIEEQMRSKVCGPAQTQLGAPGQQQYGAGQYGHQYY